MAPVQDDANPKVQNIYLHQQIFIVWFRFKMRLTQQKEMIIQ